MTGEEIKDALLGEYPVICKGVEYLKVSGVIYRKKGKGISIQAEMLDKSGRSITTARIKDVEKAANCT